MATSPDPAGAHPIIWKAHFPADIAPQLVSWGKTEGQVTNSYLELVGIMIHHSYMDDCFNIRKWTTLSFTDNTEGLWWKRKGSATSTSPPVHLLFIQAICQWFHHYVPRQKFVSGLDNVISYRLSRSQDLTDAALLDDRDDLHPQELPWRMWTPPRELVYLVSSAL